MGILYEERGSDSPYVETIMQGRAVSSGSAVRPATAHWHMVFTKHAGEVFSFVVGPWTSSGVVTFSEGAEVIWLQFKLGVFMPHLPTRGLVDSEIRLPEGANNSFWLKSSTWQHPDYHNIETFVERLAHDELLAHDPVVTAVLRDRQPEMSDRTIRHRFLQVTGLTQNHIRQMRRAQRAAALLQQGTSILDAVFESGYFDQPHMTRSLRRFIGHTPGQLMRDTPAEIVKLSQSE